MLRSVRRGYRFTGAAQFTVCAFALLPTPMWPRYAAAAGLDTLAISTLFSLYAVGVVSAMLLSPVLETRVRRATLMRTALLLEVAAALLFIFAPIFPGLLIARLASGVGVGILSAAATANLYDLGEIRRAAGEPVRPARAATASTLGGFAVGAAGAGVSAHVLPGFPDLPILLCLAVMMGLAIATAVLPLGLLPRAKSHDVSSAPEAIPSHHRRSFTGALVCAFATNSLFGMVTASAALLIAQNTTSATGLAAGLVVAGMQLCGGVAQATIPAHWEFASRVIPLTAFVGGAALVMAYTTVQFTPLLAGGAALAGLGGGMFVRRALETANTHAGPRLRERAGRTVYLVFYLGMSIPVIGGGWLADTIGLGAAVCLFLGGAVVLAAAGEILVVAGRRGQGMTRQGR